jgi:transposase
LDQQYRYFVGIDWGTQTHCVVLLNLDGRVIEQYDAVHSGEGLRMLVERLRGRTNGPSAEIAIAVEVSWGALVETLVENGFSVFSINPKQVDRFRDRFTVAGAKDDSRDALVLASSLRTDQRSYKRVELDAPEIIRLRELSRFEEELKTELRRTTNRLWQQLHRYYPQTLALSPAADDRFIWDLLSQAPMPEKGAKLSRSRLQRIFKAHRISKFTIEDAIAILRAPSLALAAGAAEAASEHVLLLLPQIALLDQQLRDVGRRIKQILQTCTEEATGDGKTPTDASLILSIPGIGPGIAATLLTEASRPIRERDYQALRCYAGTAPVTKQSAKRKTVSMRQACSARLRQAVYHWSTRSIISDSRSRQQYDQSRASGQHHPRALRGLADRLLRLLISMLKKGEKYNPARRRDHLEVVSLESASGPFIGEFLAGVSVN